MSYVGFLRHARGGVDVSYVGFLRQPAAALNSWADGPHDDGVTVNRARATIAVDVEVLED